MRINFFLSNDGGAFVLLPVPIDLNMSEQMAVLLDGDIDEIRQAVAQGELMPLGTYQDDGFFMRVVVGDLQAAEQSDWTANASAMLNLTSGRLVICGGFDVDSVEEILVAQEGDRYDACVIEVPPGRYAVTVYSYPPHDLSGSWLRIVGPADNKTYLGVSPHAEALPDYLHRTRSNEPFPIWVAYALGQLEYGEYVKNLATNPYISFLVHLQPDPTLVESSPLAPDGVLMWRDRKPERFPYGIRRFEDA